MSATIIENSYGKILQFLYPALLGILWFFIEEKEIIQLVSTNVIVQTVLFSFFQVLFAQCFPGW